MAAHPEARRDGERAGAALERAPVKRSRSNLLLIVQPWDFQPHRDGSRQYHRYDGGGMYDTWRRARSPHPNRPPED